MKVFVSVVVPVCFQILSSGSDYFRSYKETPLDSTNSYMHFKAYIVNASINAIIGICLGFLGLAAVLAATYATNYKISRIFILLTPGSRLAPAGRYLGGEQPPRILEPGAGFTLGRNLKSFGAGSMTFLGTLH